MVIVIPSMQRRWRPGWAEHKLQHPHGKAEGADDRDGHERPDAEGEDEKRQQFRAPTPPICGAGIRFPRSCHVDTCPFIWFSCDLKSSLSVCLDIFNAQNCLCFRIVTVKTIFS